MKPHATRISWTTNPDVVVFTGGGRRWPVHRNILRACKVVEKGGGLWGLQREVAAGVRDGPPRLTPAAAAAIRRATRGNLG